MNATHTPGPWIARPIDSAKMNIRSDQDTIATVYRHQGSPTLMDRAGEGDANARLIAKAPEMAAFLRDLLATDTELDDWNGKIDACLDGARALLAAIDGDEAQP